MNRYDDLPEWLRIKLEFVRVKIEQQFKTYATEEPTPVIVEEVETHTEAAAGEAGKKEYRQKYYKEHIKEKRKYYQDNKERIAKRQQTDESRAKYREQYHARREHLTPEEIQAKNEIARAQRKVREAKLRAKYPGLKLKEAKAMEKAMKGK
jgi:4-hydroxy-3-methylbut-2-enyl diphosphate reductase IspH